jgi:hypothetical protein
MVKKEFLHNFFTICWYAPSEQPPPKMVDANKVLASNASVKWSSKPTGPIKQRSKKVSRKYLRHRYRWLKVLPIKKFFLKISGHQQRWPRPLPGAILIPPALLVVADFSVWIKVFSIHGLFTRLPRRLMSWLYQELLKKKLMPDLMMGCQEQWRAGPMTVLFFN